ncbi:PREDICTED: serine/threonine-protein kinase Sgk2-like [Fragaria vesca subsp. vesca]
MVSSSQNTNKSLHSLLATKLTNLTIPPSSSSSSSPQDFDFNDVFSPPTTSSDATPPSLLVIHNRSQSFAETDILTKVVHPIIVQLRYSFQTKSKLYLIMDFMNEGHLFYHTALNKNML